MTPEQMVAEFHRAVGLGPGHARLHQKHTLRIELHREETRELIDELRDDDHAGIARELADVIYIAYGTAYALGIPMDAVFAEVHAANMRKIAPDGSFQADGQGKILKPPGWYAPDVQGVLDRHG